MVKKQRLMFGVTRLANNQFMVQRVYPKQELFGVKQFVGIFDDAEVANREYIKAAPINVQIR